MQELRKIDPNAVSMLRQKKRVLNIYDSMVTFELLGSEGLTRELEDFCLSSLKGKSNFGFKCEVFRFLQRKENANFLEGIKKKLDPKTIDVLTEVVQNE